MIAREWTFTDKSKWNRGPWDKEPDKAQWVDEATGLPCLVVRGPVGAFCGYVGVSEDHPATGKIEDLEVHEGVTYGPSPCAESEHGICHVPGDGEPDHVFWIGGHYRIGFPLLESALQFLGLVLWVRYSPKWGRA